MKKYTPVEVHWRDSVSETSEWVSKKGMKKWFREDTTFLTIGYFVKKDEKNMLLIMSRPASGSAAEQYGGLWSIPLGCIIKVKKL